jgi:hypothetical protein
MFGDDRYSRRVPFFLKDRITSIGNSQTADIDLGRNANSTFQLCFTLYALFLSSLNLLLRTTVSHLPPASGLIPLLFF